MSRKIFVISLLFFSCMATSASLRFNGTALPPVEIQTAPSTGLEALYVVNSTNGISITYTASSSTVPVTVTGYGMRGASYPETIDPSTISRNGAEITVSNLTPDTGYIFTEPAKVTYYWITDYSAHPYTISDIQPASEQECDRTFLTVSGSAPKMIYYSITGRSNEIDRQIKLSYTTLVADTESDNYISAETSVDLPHVEGTINIDPPLCDTYFHLTGDRFLRQWDEESEATSGRFSATAVNAITTAQQTAREADNELKVETAMGGSAPVEIAFHAAVSDAVVYTQWLMARDEEMQDIVYRSSDLDFSYTFTEMGTFYVRFEAADASGRCEFFGETYSVYIGESYMRCPNAFSPGASPGVNDEWKVSYKSIIDFECYIFNRWGEKMAEFHNPAQGWDGKYKGKVVPAGVYYYVIKAQGSDGKDYNLSGDINILNYTD